MHDCGVSSGDEWLSREIPKIMGSSAYNAGEAIFITWDESEGEDSPIGMIVLSPFAKVHGYSNTIRYTHSSTLLTLEEIFGLPVRLSNSASAVDLSDLFLNGTQGAVQPGGPAASASAPSVHWRPEEASKGSVFFRQKGF